MEHFRCSNCGLVFLDPMPKASEVAPVYSGRYTSFAQGDSAKAKKKLRRGRRRVRWLRRYVSGGSFLDVGCGAAAS